MYPIHHQHIMDIAKKYGFKVTRQPHNNEIVGRITNLSDGTVVKDYSSSDYTLTYKKDPSHTVKIWNGYIPPGWGEETDLSFSHYHNGKHISDGYGNQKYDCKPEAYIKDTFKESLSEARIKKANEQLDHASGRELALYEGKKKPFDVIDHLRDQGYSDARLSGNTIFTKFPEHVKEIITNLFNKKIISQLYSVGKIRSREADSEN